MHLLATQSGVIDDGDEAVDLAQSPGDVALISAADSELAALARAHDALGDEAPSLRLANQMQLSHNLSVDVYLEKTLAGAKLVVLRLLGGKAYWSYGLDETVAAARQLGFQLVVLPGDGQPDPELLAHSTLPEEQVVQLWRYLVEGGPRNMRAFLMFCRHLVDDAPEPDPPLPLLKAGLFWPGHETPSLDDLKQDWTQGAPVAAITFYRALIEGGNTAPVEALVSALDERGLNALPLFVSSLKDPVSAATIGETFNMAPPAVILNATGFAVAAYNSAGTENPLSAADCPVLQMVFSGSAQEAWESNIQGLSARDLAMNVVLPELDGRVLTRAVSFKSNAQRHEATQCNLITYAPHPDRIAYTADLAAKWAALRQKIPAERKLGIILANYPNRDGRIGNGVGYDTPQSTVGLMHALAEAGHKVGEIPASGTDLIEHLLKGPTNNLNESRLAAVKLSLENYLLTFCKLSQDLRKQVEDRWGTPEDDPFFSDGAFHLSMALFGNVAIGIQPARGYNIDPKDTYHDPALVPPHGYFAFYIWLREQFGADALVHNGKHGNLEWLPGKALALSAGCFPEAVLGPMPNIYPFIVNDPGEGTQAKRRTSAVIIDHLTPPLTRAETYGPLKDLEALIDEYYLATGLDQRRTTLLRKHILDLTRASGLDEDAGVKDMDDGEALQQIDNYICELKEAQIRDGLHILGQSPQGRLKTDLLVALARVPRNLGEGADASLIRALAADFGLSGFDPLDCTLGAPWMGPQPPELAHVTHDPWRTAGDTVERLEALARRLVTGETPCAPQWSATQEVLNALREHIEPALEACGPEETRAILAALAGRFVDPGPSGAPTRGRLDVLPTGRNFFSVDNRTVPTPAAWTLGERSAQLLVERFLQDHGRWPQTLGLSVWGTSNMRTGGDDIAQALALIGAKPKWDPSSWRVTGFEILPLAKLGRPRVDVTLRISGFFRDAFPAQIDLFDSVVRAVGGLEEEAEDNPIAAKMAAERAKLEREGLDSAEASKRAGFRVFGSKPGAYGAGLQALIDEKLWDARADLAESYINWGGYAYGGGTQGAERHELFRHRLSGLEAVVHNQDNREHDLLDSDDYYQFEGGMTAAVEHVGGARPSVYHNDHSRPERPVVRTLEEEIGRVVRSRVVNPKWIAGVMRHGYKGAFEIAATVDYMFAFAATTGAVRDHHFQLAYDAFLGDEEVRGFMGENNAPALRELSERFREAIDRGLWTPRSNSAYHHLRQLAGETIEEPV
ncbi:MAG: cobaltochelatase subunit CobN [Pseudomonadota bacterium]